VVGEEFAYSRRTRNSFAKTLHAQFTDRWQWNSRVSFAANEADNFGIGFTFICSTLANMPPIQFAG
jgi:hypothetical protein